MPHVHNIATTLKLLGPMDASFTVDEQSMEIDHSTSNRNQGPYNLMKTMPASILVLGPLLAKFRKGKYAVYLASCRLTFTRLGENGIDIKDDTPNRTICKIFLKVPT